jgi:hypothetical protein
MIKLDLDPKKILDGLSEIGERTKQLSQIIEEELGKNASKSFNSLEETAEKGTSEIGSFFKNLGTRVKDDLKSAFDVTGVLAGGKFASEIGKGVQTVFELEKAFDRLNTRLGLSQKQFDSFKTNLGRKVSGTGQTLESVLPGIETVAAKGGVKSPEQLADIGEMLGKVKATTGEDTKGLADSVIEILKTQGKAVTTQSFKEVVDALQATRTAGAFQSATQAGSIVEELSPYAKRVGLNTRELGGMTAQASQAGTAGTDILKQLVERAADPIQRQFLQATLGKDIVKNGKLNMGAIGKIDLSKFSGLSKEQFGQVTHFEGASGGDFARFVEAFQSGNEKFKKVTGGANETSIQFQTATDNLSSKIDRFKQKTFEAGREIGEGMSGMTNSLLKGDFAGALEKGKGTLKNTGDNAGTLGAALGLTTAVGVLAGGSAKRLLTGMGGLGGGIAKGEIAKAAGVTPVYVTNANEIGGGTASATTDALSKLGKFGSIAKGAVGVGAAWEVGSQVGGALNQVPAVEAAFQSFFNLVSRTMGGKGIQSDAEIAHAIERGMGKATVKVEQKGPYTNPSAVKGRGGTH